MTFYEIPISPGAQAFYITLAGVPYRLALAWRSHALGGWFLDVLTAAGAPVVAGIPLVTGVDLLEPYPDLKFGGSLIVVTDGDAMAAPTYDGLGVQSRLYFGVEP